MANETNFTTITPVKSSSSNVTGSHDGFVEIHSAESHTMQPIQVSSHGRSLTVSQTALPQTGVFDHPNTLIIGGECLLLLAVASVLSRRFFRNKWKADQFGKIK